VLLLLSTAAAAAAGCGCCGQQVRFLGAVLLYCSQLLLVLYCSQLLLVLYCCTAHSCCWSCTGVLLTAAAGPVLLYCSQLLLVLYCCTARSCCWSCTAAWQGQLDMRSMGSGCCCCTCFQHSVQGPAAATRAAAATGGARGSPNVLTGFLTKPMVDVRAIPSLSKASCSSTGKGVITHKHSKAALLEIRGLCSQL
jgi:hypothetical protein